MGGKEAPEKRRARQKILSERRRSEWLTAHPCPCGQPSVIIHGGPRNSVWTCRDDVREERLSIATTMCVDCELTRAAEYRAGQNDRRRAKETERKRTARAKERATRPKKEYISLVDRMDERTPRLPRKPQERPIPLFTEPWVCACGQSFTRAMLRSRHQKIECPIFVWRVVS